MNARVRDYVPVSLTWFLCCAATALLAGWPSIGDAKPKSQLPNYHCACTCKSNAKDSQGNPVAESIDHYQTWDDRPGVDPCAAPVGRRCRVKEANLPGTYGPCLGNPITPGSSQAPILPGATAPLMPGNVAPPPSRR